ncbi:DUF58 domain-containing protein [candidate division KSB1 bacterium]|nr:MAG: DUF58 domain-containing protein [candidate division KSB1 bacterium]
MPALNNLLQPEFVSRLKNMQLRARLVVEGFMVGLHKSPYHGFSVEFAEHRPYMPGDSLRNLDWKVYAKTDRYYVKEYEEETNLKAYLLLDISNSMNFGTTGVTKFQYASYLAAALAYLMIQQRDAVGLTTYDTEVRAYLPPRSVRTYLNPLLSQLERTQPSNRTEIAKNMHAVAERISRRGLIIVLSDLLDDPTSILSGLKHFRHDGHEVLVFHILDPRELDFAYSGDVRFRDLETQEEMPTQPWHLRKEYRGLMSEFIEKLRRGCREDRIDYTLLNTQTPYSEALIQYLTKRKRLR